MIADPLGMFSVLGTKPKGDGVQFNVAVEMEIEGSERPAFVGEIVLLAYP